MIETHLKALARANFFAGIDPVHAEKLIDCLSPKIKLYEKNEIIIKAGDSVQSIGIILSGRARAYAEDLDGNQTLMTNLTPLSVFGEILVSTRTHKSPVTVYAASDVTVAFIEYDKTFSICSEGCDAHREFMQNMLKAIGDKYFQLFDRINILREKSLRDKILAYLHVLGEKEKGRGEAYRQVKLPFSKTTLAEYLLANRSALSRELQRMINDGIIKMNGREIILLSSDSGYRSQYI